MTLRSRCILLCSLLLLAACGSPTEDAGASAVAASGASAAAMPPPASAPVEAPPAVDASEAPADVSPPEVAAEAALAESESEPLAEPTVYGADGMHPVCEAYFQRARRCFARAPAGRAALLQQSLAATRAELLSADADTCREISRQFDDMAQAMACEAGGVAETQENSAFR